jgi:hypothetical protein
MKPLETRSIAHLQKPVVRKKQLQKCLVRTECENPLLLQRRRKVLSCSLTQELQKDSDIPETLSLLWFLFFEAFKEAAAQQSTNLWCYKK